MLKLCLSRACAAPWLTMAINTYNTLHDCTCIIIIICTHNYNDYVNVIITRTSDAQIMIESCMRSSMAHHGNQYLQYIT